MSQGREGVGRASLRTLGASPAANFNSNNSCSSLRSHHLVTSLRDRLPKVAPPVRRQLRCAVREASWLGKSRLHQQPESRRRPPPKLNPPVDFQGLCALICSYPLGSLSSRDSELDARLCTDKWPPASGIGLGAARSRTNTGGLNPNKSWSSVLGSLLAAELRLRARLGRGCAQDKGGGGQRLSTWHTPAVLKCCSAQSSTEGRPLV